MAILRRRVYHSGTPPYLVDVSRSLQTLDLTTGTDTAEVVSYVPHSSYVSSQTLLQVIADLVGNDVLMDTERNGINQLINEGVLSLQGFKFDLTMLTSPLRAEVGPGKAKLHQTTELYNIYEILTDTIFTVPAMVNIGWYRRDLINIVFVDTANPTLVPYLEYVPGLEMAVVAPRHTISDKYISATKCTYPLHSILYHDIGGTTTFVEYDIVYLLAGFKETVELIHTGFFKKANHGYYAELHEKRTFTDKEGNPLPVNAGTNGLSYLDQASVYDIESITGHNPTGTISLQEPDLQLSEEIAEGDLLTFPFTVTEVLNQYSSIQDVEMAFFEVALDKDTVPQEGVSAYLYTAKYFVNNNNNGIVTIEGVSVGPSLTTLDLSMSIATFTKLTYNNITFETATAPVTTSDFIMVISGTGLYQMAKIQQIVSNIQIKIDNLPIALDTTSKVLFFKNSSVGLSGQVIDSAFLAALTEEERMLYDRAYPASTHTGIGSLEYSDAGVWKGFVHGTNDMSDGHDWTSVNQTFTINVTIGGAPQGVKTVTLNANCIDMTAFVAHLAARMTAASVTGVECYDGGNGHVGIRTLAAGPTESFVLAAGSGIFDALYTLGISAGTYSGADHTDIAEFFATPASSSTRLFYHMPNPPGTFTGHIKTVIPFKIRINYNQWYFVRMAMRNRGVPYGSYGIRPKLVVLDPTWAATGSTSLNGYYNLSINTNEGLYPFKEDGNIIFQLFDAYGDIAEPSLGRAAVGYPTQYRLIAKNLNGSAFTQPVVSGEAYVDVINGIVAFMNNPFEEPVNLYGTYYYNSILSGKLETSGITHEMTDGEIWNLHTLIEQLLNPSVVVKSGSTTFILSIAPYTMDPVGSDLPYDFEPGIVLRYDESANPDFGWVKARASDFRTFGDIMVLERIDDAKFRAIQLGYIDNIGTLGIFYTPIITDEYGANLLPSTVYYLSSTTAGKLTRIKPAIPQPILLTFDDNAGGGVVDGIVILSEANHSSMLYQNTQILQNEVDQLQMNLDAQKTRLQLAEQQTLNQELRIEFLEGRQSNQSDTFTELFQNTDVLDPNYENSILMQTDIQADNDWNNNWKERTQDYGPSFKNGFMRPRRYFFMMEPRDYYNLDGVGQGVLKQAISRYDSVNNCYWFLTTKAANDVSEINMIGPHFKNGLVEVLGNWFLPPMGSNTSYNGIEVDTTGTYLYITMMGDTAGVAAHPNVLYKIAINSSSMSTQGMRLGLSNVAIGQTLAIDYGATITGSKVKSCTANGTVTVTTAAGTSDLRIGMAMWSATYFTLETYVVSITNSTTFVVSRAAAGSGTENFTFSDVTGRFLESFANTNMFLDCTMWEATNTDIGYIYTTAAAGANRSFDIRFRQTAVDTSWPKLLSASALPNITMNPYLINGNNVGTRTMIKDHANNLLWFKLTDATSGMRFIYRINLSTDIVSNVMLSHSGRFRCTRGVTESGNSGITISKEGDLLEVVSTASNGNFISKRALKSALWAENQVDYAYHMNAMSIIGNPTSPCACAVESSRYFWSGDTGQAANACDIFRFDTTTGNYKAARLTNANWTGLWDFCTDGTTLWILGSDGTNSDIFYGAISLFVTLMGSDNPNTHPPASTIRLGIDWGTLVTMGASRTNNKGGICYDSDSAIVYVTNNTTVKIDTLTPAGVYTASVFDLPPPTFSWTGIAYKNGKIFVRDFTNSTNPNRIYVIDKTLSSTTAWYRFHIYQDPSETFAASGPRAMDFSGNAIVSVSSGYLQFYRQKTLEDNSVLQLHTFIQRSDDGSTTLNPYSPLLSNNIICHTEIVERYFDPTQFTDKRDVPDKNYMAVGYSDEGFTLLHLDEYFGNATVLGIPRYDVRKIRFQHYKRGAANIIVSTVDGHVGSLFIEKDMILYGMAASAGGFNPFGMIDLKAGKAYRFAPAASTVSGQTYQGLLSQRNDGLGYAGLYNSELDITYVNVPAPYNIHARTFMKNDSSDYNQENPKTFVTIGVWDGGLPGNIRSDMLVIDWDANGNRIPSKVFNTIFGAVSAFSGTFIAPSGYIFGGAWLLTGQLYVVTNDGLSGTSDVGRKVFAWQIANDSSGSAQLGTNIGAGFVVNISQKSRCWRTASGTWRHILTLGIQEDSSGNGIGRLMLYDVETGYAEAIHQGADGSLFSYASDNYEDLAVTSLITTTANTALGIGVYRKQRFPDRVSTSLYNNWSPSSLGDILINTDRPVFALPIYNSTTIHSNTPVARIHGQYNIISNHCNLGLQFLHIAWTDNSIYQTKEFNIADPQAIHYIEHWGVE